MTTEVKLPAVPPMNGSFKPEAKDGENVWPEYFDTATVDVEIDPDYSTLTYLVVHMPGIGNARLYIHRDHRLALIRELSRGDLF